MGMDFTGERFVPELKSGKISYEHWHRYIFAASFCSGKKVLDLACGEGYGSFHLSKVADTVVGVDVDENSVAYAAKTYVVSNLTYIKSDASQLPFADATFDAIISFETLEHLDEESQIKFLKEVKRVLQKDGVLLISTPNKKVYSDDAAYENPYHLNEFYEADFQDFLKNYFPKVNLYEQQVICGSVILQKGESNLKSEYIRLTETGYQPSENGILKNLEYMIAICTNANSDLNTEKGSLLLDEDNLLYKEKFN